MTADPPRAPRRAPPASCAREPAHGGDAASIALTFFVGVIASKWLGSPQTSIAVLGAAVLLFLIVAIGRNLRK